VQYPFDVWRQNYLPQHALSRFGGFVSHNQIPWLKNYLINWFIKRYNVNMSEALESSPNHYASFHDFFIRKLKPEARPIDSNPLSICSPCDGAVSQFGKIKENTLLQAKGREYTLEALLGNDNDAKSFYNGHFLTTYLAPKDYHRVHMPCDGILQTMRYIPGKLYSVNPLTTDHIDNLFARNERVVSLFTHEGQSFAIILVGAMIVGSISTSWAGVQAPQSSKQIKTIHYDQTPEKYIRLDKGAEMGYFSLGSTVIVLLAENVRFEYDVSQSSRLVVGQRIGHFLP
jgi:phosphatidylserine decarboxylase